MIRAIIISLVLVLALSKQYKQFLDLRAQCQQQQQFKSCRFPVILDTDPLQDENLRCAQDYAKANTCFYTYSKCLPKGTKDQNEEMPLVCWACYDNLDYSSQLYRKFKDCLGKEMGENVVLLSLVLLLMALVL